MSKKKTAALDRRDFFRKVGLGAGVAAAGLAATSAEAATPERAAPKTSGYQETAHVKKYYELAKF